MRDRDREFAADQERRVDLWRANKNRDEAIESVRVREREGGRQAGRMRTEEEREKTQKEGFFFKVENKGWAYKKVVHDMWKIREDQKDARKRLFSLVNKNEKERKMGENERQQDTQKVFSKSWTSVSGMMVSSAPSPSPSTAKCVLSTLSLQVEDETGIGPDDVEDTPFERKSVRMFVDKEQRKKSHLGATCGTIIAACLEPPIHAVLVEHMPTREQPQVLLWVIIFQTDEALIGQNKWVSKSHCPKT